MSAETDHAFSVITHQNVQLRRGKHRSPDKGACVVELASMLAGEPFSDHPRAVCPVIAAFMRTVNDSLPESELGALRPYAPAIVGSRGGRRQRRSRARRCARWAAELGPSSRLLTWGASRWMGAEQAGALAARAALRAGGAEKALTLAEALIADGAPPDPELDWVGPALAAEQPAPAGGDGA
jgi:hypothetical protein